MSSEDKYLTVTALTKYIKRKFDYDPYLERIFLTGEISNFRNRPNSHQYFSLKDEKSKISAIMFKGNYAKLKFQPEEGMKVRVTGKIGLYEPSGSYQIYIDSMEPDGVGALYQAYEQLKNKLQAEGVFDLPKKAIPTYPKKIAVITSPSGSVIKDIITTVNRRFPIVQLELFPAQVQGEKAADDLVKQLNRVNESDDYDTIIIGRGGGSIEDLWPFNEEKVARAIVDSKIPVISSVGHETDTTISDLVADVRAATPTAAAELATPVLRDIEIRIDELKNRLFKVQARNLKNQQDRLTKITARPVMKNPSRIYDTYAQKVDVLTNNLKNNFRNLYNQKIQSFNNLKAELKSVSPEQEIKVRRLQLKNIDDNLINEYKVILSTKRNNFINVASSLDNLSPLKTLARGYSIISTDQGIVKTVNQLEVGKDVNIQVNDGTAKAKILNTEENKNAK